MTPFVSRLILFLYLCFSVPSLSFAQTLAPTPSILGIADMHSHPFANEGFGGLFFQGKPFSEGGLSEAMGSCKEAHGIGGLGDLVGSVLNGHYGHNTDGFPSFKGWPAWNNLNHQMIYYEWLKRAHQGGLQLIVAHAVNSDALCSKMKIKDGYNCNDMKAVDRQIQAAYDMEAYIERIEGGKAKSWLKIVKSSAEARRAIGEGKLAMVLGIEVDTLFDCGVGRCDAAHVDAELEKYKAKGVRHIIPIHVTDNAFGGSALYTPYLFNFANKVTNGDFFAAEDCYDEGYTYRETDAKAKAKEKEKEKEKEKSLEQSPLSLLPEYPPFRAFCNAKGLSPLGNHLIKSMMKNHIIIDVDHMGAKTVNDVLTLAETYRYPLASGHTGFTETSALGQKRSEAQKTDLQLRRLMRLGGVVGPILQQGAEDEVVDHGSVANNCDLSSRSFAQAYSYAKSVAQEEMAFPAVAYGSDFNGLIAMPAPRFGKEACGGSFTQALVQGRRVSYPIHSTWTGANFDRLKAGSRTFDINTDGFTQVGLLPDFLEDLRVIGVSDEDMKPLFRSAEAYIRMWERAESFIFLDP